MNSTSKEGIARGLALIGAILSSAPLMFGVAYYEPPMISFIVKTVPNWKGDFSSILVALGTIILVLVLYNLTYNQVYRWSKMILK